MKIHEKISALMAARGIQSNAELARLISGEKELTNNTRTNFTRYMSGAIVFPDSIKEKISRHFRVTLDYLISERKQEEEYLVPVVAMASCGEANMYYNEDIDLVVTSTFSNPTVYAVRADGDSMMNDTSTSIKHGEIVFCDPSVKIENGDIVHFLYDGESGIKKYYEDINNRTVTLVPNNPTYPPFTVIPEQFDNTCFVKVVGKELRF